MNLLPAGRGKFLLGLGEGEKSLLTGILRLYPRVTSAQILHGRSDKPPESKETQELLEEALASQRAENKKTLEAFLADAKRFRKTETGWKLTLTLVEAEWLLQILNDIRVGSWIRLGSPENFHDILNEENAGDVGAMEIAGHFQSGLLIALSRTRGR